MFKRQTSGPVLCPACGTMVSVTDERCYRCGRRYPGLFGYAGVLKRFGADMGFVPLVMGGCGVLYLITLLLSGSNIRMGGLFSMLAPDSTILYLFGASGAYPVFAHHRWWTVLTAGWLHGGLLHIGFNLLWLRQLAPAVANLFGPGRMIIIYTLAGIGGSLLSSVAGQYLRFLPHFLQGAQLTVGASAAIFGLLGAMVAYGKRTGSTSIGSQAWGYAVVLFVFGVLMPGVDNFAHAGGFLGGYLTSLWLDPLKPERTDHLVGAIVCLGVTVLAVLVSIGDGLLQFFAR